MIKALIACFNDAQLLQWTLASLVGYVDEIIAVVASWEFFNETHPFPSDESIDLLERYGAKVIQKVNISQIEHRNMLLDQLKPNDWGLVIDADETLYNPSMLATLDEHEHTHYQVWIYNPFRKEYFHDFLPFLKVDKKNNRLFKNIAHLHYHVKHNMLFRGKECLWLDGDKSPEATMGIVHWRNLRDQARTDIKVKFYNRRGTKRVEGIGHWSYWLFPSCWEMCKYYNGDMDFPECINIKYGKCNAVIGKENIQTGEKEYPKQKEYIYDPKKIVEQIEKRVFCRRK